MTIDLTSTCWISPPPRLMRREEISRSSAGQTIKKDLGPPLWVAEMQSRALTISEADWHYAQLLKAEVEGVLVRASEFTWQKGCRGAMAGVTVGSVSGRRLKLDGLPSGFVLASGARVSVLTSSGHEYFQTLDDSDLAAGFEVIPAPRSVVVGSAVHLTPPLIELSISPGSIQLQKVGVARRRVSFSGVQVIR